MHTIIITDPITTAYFEKYRYIFTPFLNDEGGNISHCPWDGTSYSIERAVPSLFDAIKGHPIWRVIILVNPYKEGLFPYNPLNPYDFDCNSKEANPNNEYLFQENPIPLVRLTHMLAGFPPLGVKGYDKQRKEIVKYSEEEVIKYKAVSQKYLLKENRPIEIILLSSREVEHSDQYENAKEKTEIIWEKDNGIETLDFINIYPSTCRFLCYDIVNKEHSLFPREQWCFYMLALSLAVNQLPSQAINAFQLYKVTLEIEPSELKSIFEEQIEKLITIKTIIEERKNRPIELTETENNILIPPDVINVEYEKIDQDIMKHNKPIDIIAKSVENDTTYWSEKLKGTNQWINQNIFTPKEEAYETRNKVNSYIGKEYTITIHEHSEIKKAIDQLEPEVMNAYVYGLLNPDDYKKEVRTAGHRVTISLIKRLPKKYVFISFLLIFCICIFGYTALSIDAFNININVFLHSSIVILSNILLLFIGGFISLCLLPKPVMSEVQSYNKAIEVVCENLNKIADTLSKYLTSICSYMYYHSILIGMKLKEDNINATKQYQEAHQYQIDKEIEDNKLLCILYNVPLKKTFLGKANIIIDDETLFEKPSHCRYYMMNPNKNDKTLKIVNTGEKIYAPYSFIDKIKFTCENTGFSKSKNKIPAENNNAEHNNLHNC